MNRIEPTLDDVLNDILLAQESSKTPFAPDELAGWTTRFPQFEREITEFFVTEIELETMPNREDSFVFNEKFAARSRQVLADVLQNARRSEIDVPLESLQKQAAALGLRFPELARRVGMSLQLLMSLEQRQAAAISDKAIRKLAAALELSVESLQTFFAQPPQLLAGASYKSADQPAAGQKQDFAELVKKDLKLTEAEKQDLLD